MRDFVIGPIMTPSRGRFEKGRWLLDGQVVCPRCNRVVERGLMLPEGFCVGCHIRGEIGHMATRLRAGAPP